MKSGSSLSPVLSGYLQAAASTKKASPIVQHVLIGLDLTSLAQSRMPDAAEAACAAAVSQGKLLGLRAGVTYMGTPAYIVA